MTRDQQDTLSSTAARQLWQTARLSHGTSREAANVTPQPQFTPAVTSETVIWGVEVTGGVDGYGFYPATLLYPVVPGSGSGSWEEGDEVLLLPLPGQTFEEEGTALARLVGFRDDGTAVYAPTAAPGTVAASGFTGTDAAGTEFEDGQAQAVVTPAAVRVVADYTAAADDYLIWVDTSDGPIEVTIPFTPSPHPKARFMAVFLWNTGGTAGATVDAVTVVGPQPFDDYTLDKNGEGALFIHWPAGSAPYPFDGSTWFPIGRFKPATDV